MSAPRRSGPPQLRLRLASRLSWLAICNFLPLSLVIYIWWQWQQANASFIADRGLLLLIGLLIGLAIVIGTVSFIILPLVGFYCRWTKWHFFNVNRWIWALPVIGAHALAAATWIASLALIMCIVWFTGYIALTAVGTGNVDEKAQALPTEQPSSTTSTPPGDRGQSSSSQTPQESP